VDTESVAELKARLANQEKRIQELLELKNSLEAGERTSLQGSGGATANYGATAGGAGGHLKASPLVRIIAINLLLLLSLHA
jgi:hypothetical protein